MVPMGHGKMEENGWEPREPGRAAKACPRGRIPARKWGMRRRRYNTGFADTARGDIGPPWLGWARPKVNKAEAENKEGSGGEGGQELGAPHVCAPVSHPVEGDA